MATTEQTQFEKALETLRRDPLYEHMARRNGITPAHTPEMYEAELQKRWGAIHEGNSEAQEAA